jgi:cellulose synthase/poly-beta-1,6-N-acetylglucosamine synthase-like glycosyltransferase
MIVLSVALGLLAVVLLLPALSDALSLIRVIGHRQPRQPREPPAAPRFLMLVPAHDEELLLPACLKSLRRLEFPAARVDIVVIADNCRDRTADIARAAGVQCLERNEPQDPGKPRAIAWALGEGGAGRLPVHGYDAIVIVDADTEVDADFATHLAQASPPLATKVLQPYNGVSNETQNALTRMAAVLSMANHGLAYVLKTRAGLTVPLSVGMCIGTEVLTRYGWTVHTICEDWELYAQLTARGVRIEEVPAARIRAQEAATLQASKTQRRRWTAGKLAVLVEHAGALLRSRHIGVAQKIDVMGELCAPGPALHLCLVAITSVATWLIRPPGFAWLTVLLVGSLTRPMFYTLLALARDREPLRAAGAFAVLPFYAIWRLWVALTSVGALTSRLWVRTERHRGAPAR